MFECHQRRDVGAVDEELERFWFSMPDMSGHVRRPAVLITIGIDGSLRTGDLANRDSASAGGLSQRS